MKKFMNGDSSPREQSAEKGKEARKSVWEFMKGGEVLKNEADDCLKMRQIGGVLS